ncbi:MAG: hypothetical protein Q4D54_09280 [Eubacteriales bacterium]|nr:hypothetical protein [Eubacteriales bacterium]
MKKIKRITIFFVLLSFVLAGCKNNKVKEYVISDKSDDTYVVDRFCDTCIKYDEHIAYNDRDLVYINGQNIYHYPDNNIVMENIMVDKMIYTDTWLYVLETNDKLHVFDMESMEDYIIDSVDGLGYDGEYIYLSQSDNKDIYYHSEKDVLNNNEFIGFGKMSVLSNARWLNLDGYQYQGDYYYWIVCGNGNTSIKKHEVSVARNRISEDKKNKDGILLDDDYIISDNNLSVTGDAAYILYQRRDGNKKYTGIQGDIYCDGIVALDFDNKKSNVVYETNDNLTRIIGFDAEKKNVYLYDVNNFNINVLDLNTNQEETIDKLPKKYNDLIFDMSKDVLFVYTDNNELVQIVELNN